LIRDILHGEQRRISLGIASSIDYNCKYYFTSDKLLSVVQEEHVLEQDDKKALGIINEAIHIPIAVIKNKSSLQATVVYMKDVLKLDFCDIARQLNRDDRTVWTTYHVGKSKISISSSDKSELTIPVSIFTSRRLSVLESVVFYLKTNHDFSLNEIANLLGKNYRTIWTVYRRAMKKSNDV
jgi:DNA-directed RNA polymerase specialized sigma24 family protein